MAVVEINGPEEVAVDSQGHIYGRTQDGKIMILTPDGKRDVSSDEIIYFTDASAKYGKNEYLYDLLESKPHGRLLSYDLATGQIKQLLEDLYFANGVA